MASLLSAAAAAATAATTTNTTNACDFRLPSHHHQAMMGDGILLNPNYGFEDDKHIIIPARRPVDPDSQLSLK